MKKRYAAVVLLLPLLLSFAAGKSAAQGYVPTQPFLRVAFNAHYEPYHFLDKRNRPCGMHVDMMNWIAAKNGILIEFLPFNTNVECIDALKNREADVILGYRNGDEAIAGFQSTSELSSTWLCLAASEEKGERIRSAQNYYSFSAALEYGTTSNSYLTRMGISRYLTLGNPQEVLEALIHDRVDMALVVYDCYKNELIDREIEEQFTILSSYVAPISYTLVVRKEDSELFRLLDDSLADMRVSNSYEEIYSKWIRKSREEISAETIRRIYSFAGLSLGIAAVLAVLAIGFNRYLNQKVKEKTGELRKANKELDRRMLQLQSESRIRFGIIEYSPTAMVSFDNSYKIVIINPAALAMAKIKGDGLGMSVKDLPIFGEIVRNINQNIFLDCQGESLRPPAVAEIYKNGKEYIYRYNFYPFREETGVHTVLLSVEDITAEEREKKSLLEQEKYSLLNQLVAGIAHEIKNPLMSIQAATSLLKSDWEDGEVRDAFILFVPDEVERINRLIERLISYAKPVKGEKDVFCISEIVKECLYLTDIAIKKYGYARELQLDETVRAYVNRDKLKQAVINVIMNGVEAMSRKTREKDGPPLKMRIEVKQDKSHGYIVIKDEGIGMSEEEIHKCTDPFYTTKSNGTGLGLTLVSQFIRDNDGVFIVNSEPGVYTEITMKFPKR